MKPDNLPFWLRLRCKFLAHKAPEFWEHFPEKNEPGPWLIQAITVSMFGPPRVKKEKWVREGLWFAYVEARSLAVDLEYDYPDKEIGLEWRVCKPS